MVTEAAQGRLVPLHRLPEGLPGDAPALAGARDRVASLLISPDEAQGKTLLLATASGKVKRVAVDAFSEQWVQLARLDTGDKVVAACFVEENDSVMLVSTSGEVISFSVAEVRQTGLPAGCIAGMRMGDGESLVAACKRAGQHLALLTGAGLLKRVTQRGWRGQRRGGQGITATPVDVKTGRLRAAACVDPTDKVLVVGNQGTAELIAAADIPALSRAARGRPLVTFRKGEEGLALCPIASGKGAA